MTATCRSVSDAAELLRRSGLPGLVDGLRGACLNTWEPWLTGPSLTNISRSGIAASWRDELFRLLHSGVALYSGSLRQDVTQALLDAGLVTSSDDIVRPGRWRMSAFAGLLIAADRDYGTGHEVHLGEDSLRFAQAVLAATPRNAVLDVGCGSGVSTAAAARTAGSVRAIDVLPDAVEATGLTCAFNPGGAVVTAEVGNFADVDLGEFDHVIVNLPGVPVPTGMPYPKAGNGGPDGLDLIRAFWTQLAVSPPCRVTMRFQSMGGAEPEVLNELRELFPAHTISIAVDSAVPMRLRDAITAERVATTTGAEPDDVAGHLAQEREVGDRTRYFCSTMNLVPGRRRFDYYSAPLAGLDPDRMWHGGDVRSVDDATVWTEYCSRLRLMPDEFWSVRGDEHVHTVGRDLHALRGDLAAGRSPADLAGVRGTDGPAARAGLELAVVLLAEVLDDIGILRAR